MRQRWERELFPASPRIGLVSTALERTQVKRRHAGCRNVSSFPPTCFTSPHTEHDSLSENDMLRSESQPWAGNGSLQRSLFLPPHLQQRCHKERLKLRVRIQIKASTQVRWRRPPW